MMEIQLITLFPELFDNFTSLGLMRRAIEEEKISIVLHHLRSFAINAHGQVDDTPYGGGSGMVLRIEAAAAAAAAAKKKNPRAPLILLSPRGKQFNQAKARELAAVGADAGGLIFLCPRYEGVDERIVETLVDEEISIGDYILMGGEVAAMAVIEAVTRLIPDVLGNPESIVTESFENRLLEHSQYTKPAVYESRAVPEVLLSGNHEQIERWRNEEALQVTLERRPDLINSEPKLSCELSTALIHYPVTDKQGDLITSSITNLDLHDLARSCRTYGLERAYIVHPSKTLRRLGKKICEHWATGFGSVYNPNRSDALAVLSIVSDFDEALTDIEQRTGKLPKIITTSAKPSPKAISFARMAAVLRTSNEPHLLLLGTGWGLAPEILERADYHLEPINGPTDYNHLSVRAAHAIMCDRLLNPRG